MWQIGISIGYIALFLGISWLVLTAVRAHWTRFDMRSAWIGLVVGWLCNLAAWVGVAGLGLLLSGCSPAPPSAPSAAVATVETAVIEVIPDRAPSAPKVEVVPFDDCGIPDAAVDLIIAFEVGSPELYERKYKGLIYPGGQSGATGGFGYDFGHRPPNVIALDWADHTAVTRLQTASGITGPMTRQLIARLADISIELGYARQVFEQVSIVEHLRLARRAFGDEVFCAAPANTRGALTSLVFNRGASLKGPNRIEMRTIRDQCLPARDWSCVAHQLRTMSRIWKGTELERGLTRRREAEAKMAETA